MQTTPTLEIGEWQESAWVSKEVQPYCFVSDIDVAYTCNDFIDRHVNLLETPKRLVDSYRSYLIQALKDIDYLIGYFLRGHRTLNMQTHYVIDTTLAKAQPWRFTAYILRYVASHWQANEIIAGDSRTIWSHLQPLLDEAFNNGSLFRIEKYIKVGHVLMDISFDIGWDAFYTKASQLKMKEGLNANPERAATLREPALYIARNFWVRKYSEAAKQVLYIGFSDITEVITTLKDRDIEELLVEMNSNQAVQALFRDQMSQSTKNVSCSQIVEGALRVIGSGGG